MTQPDGADPMVEDLEVGAGAPAPEPDAAPAPTGPEAAAPASPGRVHLTPLRDDTPPREPSAAAEEDGVAPVPAPPQATAHGRSIWSAARCLRERLFGLPARIARGGPEWPSSCDRLVPAIVSLNIVLLALTIVLLLLR